MYSIALSNDYVGLISGAAGNNNNNYKDFNWEVQLWIEWPTPGLCPGEVGRKSSMCSILLVCIFGWPLGASPAFVACRVVDWRCLEHFLHNADLKCLPSTQENSWHRNKTRRTAQAPKSLVFAMQKRVANSAMLNTKRKRGRGRGRARDQGWWV